MSAVLIPLGLSIGHLWGQPKMWAVLLSIPAGLLLSLVGLIADDT